MNGGPGVMLQVRPAGKCRWCGEPKHHSLAVLVSCMGDALERLQRQVDEMKMDALSYLKEE